MIARLFGGSAHGWSCPVPEAQSWMYVSMAPGKPVTLTGPESLPRGGREWELYVEVVGLRPDREGRFAFYCDQSVADRQAALHGQPRAERSQRESLVNVLLERYRKVPALDDEANDRGWAALGTLCDPAEEVSP